MNAPPEKPLRILLTSYDTGAQNGTNIGVEGYSHDLVAGIYQPILEQIAKVQRVDSPQRNLEACAQRARQEGCFPIHYSVAPLQDTVTIRGLPTIAVPAWEFPDPPDISDPSEPQSSWRIAADRCDQILVSGPFTQKCIQSTQTTTPIDLLPVPVDDSYFNAPAWNPDQQYSIDCSYHELTGSHFTSDTPPSTPLEQMRGYCLQRKLIRAFKSVCRSTVNRLLSQRLLNTAAKAMETAANVWAASALYEKPATRTLNLDGIVYTSIFNPDDGRKNWQDLLSGFLLTMARERDVTLVIKLVTSNPLAIGRLLSWYYNQHFQHECRLVLIDSYLTDEEMRRLAHASTYYYHTTRAEGNCLPLMDFLAAGRPALSPVHSAIGDYFDDSLGFSFQSHPEPSPWPQAPQLGLRTTWHRMVWDSIPPRLRDSLDVIRHHPERYQQMAANARNRMLDTATQADVLNRLRRVFAQVRSASTPEAVEHKRAA